MVALPPIKGGILMPGDPSECRKHAARCAELAKSASSIEEKTAFDELSRLWEATAIQMERWQRVLNENGPTVLDIS